MGAGLPNISDLQRKSNKAVVNMNSHQTEATLGRRDAVLPCEDLECTRDPGSNMCESKNIASWLIQASSLPVCFSIAGLIVELGSPSS